MDKRIIGKLNIFFKPKFYILYIRLTEEVKLPGPEPKRQNMVVSAATNLNIYEL